MVKPSTIRPATPEEAQIGAELIYLSGPEIFRYLFVDDNLRCLAILRAVFPYLGHIFSHQLAQFAEVNGKVLGIMLGYRGLDERPEVAKAHRLEAEIREWAGHSPSRLDGAHNVGLKQILTAVIRQAVADVGYENLSGEVMYNALQKLEHIDTLGGYHNMGWGPDKRVGQSGIKIVQYQKMAPGSEIPPDGVMMETVAVSDWMETTNIFEDKEW